ncbi:hypothetical protein [Rugosimonospora africana]|uniref:Uncharacterized protein n=1 Tax=Rugosimonospora africana TaxID=556532 RepID=A0A8J3QTU6_9ACTN|nr:hypothetical protein [Rugosimonospora africana]GIH16969.1 hypothetical protein Raf01_51410 [Rugosimonospora africana]
MNNPGSASSPLIDSTARLTPALGLVPAIYVPATPAPSVARAVGRILQRVAHRFGIGA